MSDFVISAYAVYWDDDLGSANEGWCAKMPASSAKSSLVKSLKPFVLGWYFASSASSFAVAFDEAVLIVWMAFAAVCIMSSCCVGIIYRRRVCGMERLQTRRYGIRNKDNELDGVLID
jgi:hypothetical protein